MVDFKHYCERAARRIGGDAHLLDTLLEAFGGKKGVLRKEGTTLRKVFQDSDLMAKVEGVLAKAGFKTELSTDEEHGLWEIETTTTSGLSLSIDWNFASFVEFQKAVELYTSLEDKLPPPFITGENGTSEEIRHARSSAREGAGGREERLIHSALQRSRRNESGAALGNDDES